MADIASHDANNVPTIQGVSSSDLRTPINIAVNPNTGAMLIDAASIGGAFVLKAGDTMTGALQFSGSTNPGVIVNSLTTTQINALTPSNGNILYNSTASQLQTYGNGQWADISKSPATKIIAPTGSGYAADYYTDGTADEIQIQAAFDAIHSLGGGTLFIRAGNYTLSTGVTLYSNIKTFGQGIGITILKTGSFNTDIFSIGSSFGTNSGSDPAGTYTNIDFQDIEIDSQSIGGTGIAMHGVTGIHIERCYIHDSSNFGIYMANPTDLWIKDSIIKNIIGNGGIQLKGSYNTWVMGCDVYNVKNGSLSKGIGSHATDGVNGRQSKDVHIIGNNLDTIDYGIDCEDDNSEVVDNTIINFTVNGIEVRNAPSSLKILGNTINQSTGNGANGINLFYTTMNISGIVINGNIVENVNTNSTSNGVFLGANSGNVIFTNNIIVNSGRYAVQNRCPRVTIGGNKYYNNATNGFFNDTGGTTVGLDIAQDTSTGAGALTTFKSQDATIDLANLSGGEFRIQTGLGTGNAGSILSFYTATDTSSGVTVQTVTEKMRIVNSANGRLLIGTTTGSVDGITLGGSVARSVLAGRHTTTNTAGNNLTIQAGGVTSQATNKSGGTLILSSGIPTGSGTSQILLKTFPATSNTLATLSSITINSGGSGYIASDVITITGGGGSGGTATVNTVGAAGELKTITINAGGINYVNGDVLTVSGGTSGTITVNTVSSTGKILIATLTTGGSGYSITTGAATTGGSGSGGTFDITIYATGEIKTISLTSAGTGYALTTGAATSGGTGSSATLNIVPFDNVDNAATTAVTISSAQNMTVVGTIGASNFSGTSSGTNTGDQTLSGLGGAPVGSAFVTIGTDATLTNERALTGTSNQITITDNGAGSTVVLSTPQNIHTGATPTFAGMSLGSSNLSTVGNISMDGTASRDMTVATSASGAGNSLIIKSGSAAAGVSTDVNSGELRLSTGAGTGAASGSILTFYTSVAGSTGTAAESVTEKMRLVSSSNGRLCIGTTTATSDGINLGGIVARSLLIVRNTTANTVGQSLTIQAGGATSGAATSNLAGGNLILASGISTGTATSSIQFKTSPAGSTGTSDNALTTIATLDGAGNLRIGDATSPTATLDVIGKLTVNSSGLVTRYNNIATTGEGVPAIYSSGRATGQTAANASVATYTLPATDGSFLVSANVLVTTSSAENFTVTVSYTDEGGTARVLTLNFQTIAGVLGTAVAFANGAVPYEGIAVHLRCKASTAITVKTAAGGTYTGCTYNAEGMITQIA